MICSESCNSEPDGTLFEGRQGKNEASQLHEGSATSYFPILKSIKF